MCPLPLAPAYRPVPDVMEKASREGMGPNPFSLGPLTVNVTEPEAPDNVS